MIDAVAHQQPKRVGRGRPKLRYAHQGGMNPPIVIIHGSALNGITDSYKRYLEGRFREIFDLRGTPLRIEFRTAANPYVKEENHVVSRLCFLRGGIYLMRVISLR